MEGILIPEFKMRALPQKRVLIFLLQNIYNATEPIGYWRRISVPIHPLRYVLM